MDGIGPAPGMAAGAVLLQELPGALCFARKVGHFANKIGRSAFKRPK
jgi:hypothetical protein